MHHIFAHFKQSHHYSMLRTVSIPDNIISFIIPAGMIAPTYASVLLALLIAGKVLYLVGSFLLHHFLLRPTILLSQRSQI